MNYDEWRRDMRETCTCQCGYRMRNLRPNSKSIIWWYVGKTHHDNAEGTCNAEIPFTVSDTRAVVDPPRPEVNVYSDTFTTRMPRFASLSPDGRQVVFASLGRLHIKDVDGGAPRPLTAADGDFPLFPSLSRAGPRLCFLRRHAPPPGELRTPPPH